MKYDGSNSYNGYPLEHSYKTTFLQKIQANGLQIKSSMWSGWEPGPDAQGHGGTDTSCPGDPGVGAEVMRQHSYTVSDIKVFGTHKMGPEATLCDGNSGKFMN